jgi:ankyrin repeat protein
MNIFKPQVKRLVEKKDYNGLNRLLASDPKLANEGIKIPYDIFCKVKAHPLHRICDGVFAGKITDNEAVELAKIFIENGADIDGDKAKDDGTPLLAAASLHAEKTGIFFIDNGADVHYVYKGDGASALHWAAFCGRDKLVDRLIKANAAIDEPDTEHNSTPLGWAIHCLMSNVSGNSHNQTACIKLLLQAGANAEKLGKEANDYLKALAKKDLELVKLLK